MEKEKEREKEKEDHGKVTSEKLIEGKKRYMGVCVCGFVISVEGLLQVPRLTGHCRNNVLIHVCLSFLLPL